MINITVICESQTAAAASGRVSSKLKFESMNQNDKVNVWDDDGGWRTRYEPNGDETSHEHTHSLVGMGRAVSTSLQRCENSWNFKF